MVQDALGAARLVAHERRATATRNPAAGYLADGAVEALARGAEHSAPMDRQPDASPRGGRAPAKGVAPETPSATAAPPGDCSSASPRPRGVSLTAFLAPETTTACGGASTRPGWAGSPGAQM